MSRLDDQTVAQLLSDLDDVSAQRRAKLAAAAATAKQQDELPPVPLRDMLDELQIAQPDRLEWPDSWFGRVDPGDADACQQLWCAALLTCIRSAVGLLPDDVNGSGHSRPVGSSWIGSRDFHTMCALAGVDGEACVYRLSRLQCDPEMHRALSGERASTNAEART
jgi:hypothetical protein